MGLEHTRAMGAFMPEWMSNLADDARYWLKYGSQIGEPYLNEYNRLDWKQFAKSALRGAPLAVIVQNMLSEGMPSYADSYPGRVAQQSVMERIDRERVGGDFEAGPSYYINTQKKASSEGLSPVVPPDMIGPEGAKRDNWWGHRMSNSQQNDLEKTLANFDYDVNSEYSNTRGQNDYGPRNIAEFYEKILNQDMRNLIKK